MRTLIQTVLSYLIFWLGIKVYNLHDGTITFASFLVAIVLLIDFILISLMRIWIKKETICIILFLFIYFLLFYIATGSFSFIYIFDDDTDIKRLNICYTFPVFISGILLYLYIYLKKKRILKA